ncbi:acyl carrier protein [Pseudobacteroides cellulosolvens]|uniref:Acyl carrier protein familyprotein n=1 Tax=Pseudobacteroides cellulosolvens ATCC 35603 = DSM 2933 TaxID=398512 RepID=A0A0L6JK33_9FIRM|nr:phosphopantetheine-binding protein [Pseudobacteroides cellulosolvens]KNY26221.1 acyl carrier protein familyprotein [Pseudobacteroides cellulosolvens ATCC 35603 = DSM 2933]
MNMKENEVYDKVKEIVVDYLRVSENEVNPETNLVEELCADSIALVELGFRFSETFSIPMVEGNSELFIMKNLVNYILCKMQEV